MTKNIIKVKLNILNLLHKFDIIIEIYYLKI